jgi:hypothetical protein
MIICGSLTLGKSFDFVSAYFWLSVALLFFEEAALSNPGHYPEASCVCFRCLDTALNVHIE